jgi:4-hydroxybenzoate polyprenyltransferase
MAAHFINVIKDMKADQISEIKGLPQLLGTRKSIVSAALLIALGLFVIFYS